MRFNPVSLKNLDRTRHGFAKRGTIHPLHRVWRSMIQRCTNPRDARFATYGARGVSVCDRWLRFENFLADMGERPAGVGKCGRSLYSIDRRDTNGNYEPANVKWSTAREQGERTTRTHLLTCAGRTMPLARWAEELGVSHATLLRRFARGMSEEEVITLPVRRRVR